MQADQAAFDVIRMADGTLAETRTALQAHDADHVATAVLAEVMGRTTLFDGPPTPVLVQFSLELGDRVLQYGLTVGPQGPTLQPGWAEDPKVEIRQDFGEFLRAVYGTGASCHDATRVVSIMNEPGPATDDLEDPWLAELKAATIAAGQALRACSPYEIELGSLARRFGSDKWGDHFYTPCYERHLAPYRDQRIKLLEIGVGGFESPTAGGESLRMWKYFFPRGLVYGLDLFNKSALDEPRIRTIQGDQRDAKLLAWLAHEIGPFDIIIDDGSHISADVIGSFGTLFPMLADGGMYAIEDLQTSYWPGWNGGRTDVNDPETSIGFLKTLLDGLHHQDRLAGHICEPSDIERNVRSIHLYHNIAFVERGVNNEQSAPSWVRRNQNDMDLIPKGSMRRVNAT